MKLCHTNRSGPVFWDTVYTVYTIYTKRLLRNMSGSLTVV